MIKLIVVGASNPTIIRLIEDINLHKKKNKIQILGFLDNDIKKKNVDFFGYKIFGGFDQIKKFDKKNIFLTNTIASLSSLRKETSEYFINKGYRFMNIIHPNINLGSVEIGNGNIIYENSLIQPFVKIGNHCIISSNAGIAHETKIGDFVFVGPSTYICGRVKIKDGVFIGVGTTILPDIKIDSNITIGAGSLVNKNLSSNKRIFVTKDRWILK